MVANVYNIDWDCDSRTLAELPTETSIAIADDLFEFEIQDAITETLANDYGFCVNGFSYDLED